MSAERRERSRTHPLDGRFEHRFQGIILDKLKIRKERSRIRLISKLELHFFALIIVDRLGILKSQAMFLDLDQFSADQFMRGLIPKVLSFSLCVGSGKSVLFVHIAK